MSHSSSAAIARFDGSASNDQFDERTHLSPLAEKIETATPGQQSTLPITPDATQHIVDDSQATIAAVEEKSLLITPQLTQSVSTGPRSSQVEPDEAGETNFMKSPPVDVRMSHRKTTATSVASPSTSPKPSQHSAFEEVSEDSEAKDPSVGLSTPIAYYTPLKDMPYFLNRSSSFHSAGSPDILALVTTASTPPTRATKGPKHHTTSFKVTDLSNYPSQTTIQVFRAYANALPVAEAGDVVLLRSFNVKSLNRQPCLTSADESAWCVWRYGKPLWDKKEGGFSEVRSREEVKGPAVEHGEGEWAEVERLRAWYVRSIKGDLAEKAHRTRSKDKGEDVSQLSQA